MSPESVQERILPPENLPLRTSSFVGREREVAEVRSSVGSGRLITLTGAGGCGKTRLALEVASSLLDGFPDGVFWVELAGLSDTGLVPETVARTLGARWGDGTSPEGGLAKRIGSGRVLLILDNCEHLVGACAELSEFLLRSCPGLTVVATSREVLRVAGEVAWPVPSLSLPDPGAGHDPEKILDYGAVRLFVERAASSGGFALTGENAGAVARICQRLDGVPLAIELAAARTRVLSPAQISSRLDDRFLLLTGGSRVVLPRHRTLRAAMDWGHDLLPEDERSLLRRLSVFSDGFTLEAAEAVCPGDDLDANDVLGMLGRLVEKSMVFVTRRGEETRYGMLETVTQYASEKLEDSGESGPARDAQAGFFLRLSEEAEQGLMGAAQADWTDRLAADHGNIQAALRRLAERGDAASVMRMAGALWWYWFLRGRYAEGRKWLEEALAAGDDAPVLRRAKALTVAGDLAFLQSEYGIARERLEEGLAFYRRARDPRGAASAVQLLGSIEREQGRYERAEVFHEESLSLSRELGDEWGVAHSLNYLGFVALLRGDQGRATGLCSRASGMFADLGDGEGIAWSRILLGLAALHDGWHERAGELLDEGLTLCKEAAYKEGAAWALDGLGTLARRQDVHDRAETLLRESLGLHRGLGDRWRTASLFEGLASAAAARGHHERAAVLFGAAAALRERLSDPVPPCEKEDRDRGEGAARIGLGRARFARASAKGRGMSLEQAYEYALEPAREPEPSPVARETVLSARETEVLSLVSEGLTDHEVAGRLYLSPRTVGQHLRNVYRKLGVGSRTAATRAAIERDLI